LGSDIIQELYKDNDYKKMKKMVMEVVRQNFRPEFINRIDELIVFHNLKKDHIQKIAHMQLDLLQKRLVDHQINITYGKDVFEFLAEVGFDPVYGARPLKRAIQKLIENPLAKQILDGKIMKDDTILISMSAGNKINFKKT